MKCWWCGGEGLEPLGGDGGSAEPHRGRLPRQQAVPAQSQSVSTVQYSTVQAVPAQCTVSTVLNHAANIEPLSPDIYIYSIFSE